MTRDATWRITIWKLLLNEIFDYCKQKQTLAYQWIRTVKSGSRSENSRHLWVSIGHVIPQINQAFAARYWSSRYHRLLSYQLVYESRLLLQSSVRLCESTSYFQCYNSRLAIWDLNHGEKNINKHWYNFNRSTMFRRLDHVSFYLELRSPVKCSQKSNLTQLTDRDADWWTFHDFYLAGKKFFFFLF